MKNKSQNIFGDILRNIITVNVTCLAISIIFGIPIKNRLAFLFFGIMLGINFYFLQRIQVYAERANISEDIVKIVENVVVLERTIEDLQTLCTDEDVLGRCRNEVTNELNKIKKEIYLDKYEERL